MISRIKLFAQLKKEQKMIFIQAYLLSAVFRFRILFTPFNKLAKKMGDVGVETTTEYDYSNHQYIRNVRKVVNVVGRNTLWQSLCLVKALTAQCLLNKKKIDNTVYLGLKKDENNNILAHAWIRSGNRYLTGYENMHEYSVVAKFGSVFHV